jgi:spore maturation protein CgeB
MAEMGFCPSGRLFEAAACGTAILSDSWNGLDGFFKPGRELLVCETAEDTAAAMALPDDELARIGQAARERVLQEHTAERRVQDFERAVQAAMAKMDFVEA